MTDPFALLGLPRRPWVEPETVQDRYRARAADAHPDRPGGSAATLAALNEARFLLASHSRRLKSLAASETAETPHPFEPDWTLFARIGSIDRSAKEWNQTFNATSNPLQKAVLIARQKSLRAELLEIRNLLNQQIEHLTAATKEADRRWPETTAGTILTLAEAWTYAERWNATLDEARALLDGA